MYSTVIFIMIMLSQTCSFFPQATLIFLFDLINLIMCLLSVIYCSHCRTLNTASAYQLATKSAAVYLTTFLIYCNAWHDNCACLSYTVLFFKVCYG